MGSGLVIFPLRGRRMRSIRRGQVSEPNYILGVSEPMPLGVLIVVQVPLAT